VWELPGTHANVCGDVYVVPSTSIEPTGLAVTIIETVTGEDVVLVELVVDESVELVVELVVVLALV
jgi:signal peptidase I